MTFAFFRGRGCRRWVDNCNGGDGIGVARRSLRSRTHGGQGRGLILWDNGNKTGFVGPQKVTGRQILFLENDAAVAGDSTRHGVNEGPFQRARRR